MNLLKIGGMTGSGPLKCTLYSWTNYLVPPFQRNLENDFEGYSCKKFNIFKKI